MKLWRLTTSSSSWLTNLLSLADIKSWWEWKLITSTYIKIFNTNNIKQIQITITCKEGHKVEKKHTSNKKKTKNFFRIGPQTLGCQMSTKNNNRIQFNRPVTHGHSFQRNLQLKNYAEHLASKIFLDHVLFDAFSYQNLLCSLQPRQSHFLQLTDLFLFLSSAHEELYHELPGDELCDHYHHHHLLPCHYHLSPWNLLGFGHLTFPHFYPMAPDPAIQNRVRFSFM